MPTHELDGSWGTELVLDKIAPSASRRGKFRGAVRSLADLRTLAEQSVGGSE